jgi:hypothetical protein
MVRMMFLATILGLALSSTGTILADEEKVTADKLPKAVADVVKAKFPGAEFTSITKETVDGKVTYDLEMKHKGIKCEMDIKEDGTIINIEREIAVKDAPKAVLAAVEKKYPKSTIKEVMEIKELKGKEEVLEGYEVVFVTADKKNAELMVTADGKIVEEEVDGKKILEKK